MTVGHTSRTQTGVPNARLSSASHSRVINKARVLGWNRRPESPRATEKANLMTACSRVSESLVFRVPHVRCANVGEFLSVAGSSLLRSIAVVAWGAATSPFRVAGPGALPFLSRQNRDAVIPSDWGRGARDLLFGSQQRQNSYVVIPRSAARCKRASLSRATRNPS